MTFENKILKPRLRLGDYVTANDKYINMLTSIKAYDTIKMYNKVGIIVGTFKPRSQVKFSVSYLSGHVQSFYKDELRLATPEEVEQYELEKTTNKYNI